MTKSKLFGTDGIRARYGTFPLTPESILKLGRSIEQIYKKSKILIGRDTRESGKEIEAIITSALSQDIRVRSMGVIPTPGLAYTAGILDYDLGVMVTASHNPYEDNGIKIFTSEGEKISRPIEEKVEWHFHSRDNAAMGEPQPVSLLDERRDSYIQFLSHTMNQLDLSNMTIILDCAHGACYQIAPQVFKKTKCNLVTIGTDPDGKNINFKRGSTQLECLKDTIASNGADIGFAFDGDGDRVVAIDKSGNVLNGDHLFFLISRYFLSQGWLLKNQVVVGTIMANIGFEKAINRLGLKLIRTDVGDRNVFQAMKMHTSPLGGEQSGHIILRPWQRTGDGILTAIFFLKALTYFDLKPELVFEQLELYPQVTLSIPVREKKSLPHWQELNKIKADFKKENNGYARMIIRYSGTEPKIRIMVESQHHDLIDHYLAKVKNLINSRIGG